MYVRICITDIYTIVATKYIAIKFMFLWMSIPETKSTKNNMGTIAIDKDMRIK